MPELKGIFALDKIRLKLVITFKDNSLFKIEKNTIYVNSSSTELQRGPALEALKTLVVDSHVKEQARPVLTETASSRVSDIGSKNKYEEELEFFEGKLPPNDIKILRAAYYIRSVHESGESVAKLKEELSIRYGQRGANIANLCTSGYFESHIRPMYEELATRPNFKLEMFSENYELIVKDAFFVVFVSAGDSIEQLIAKIIDKIQFNKIYGQHEITIHAIGTENVNKVQKLLDTPEVNSLFTSSPDITRRGTIAAATIHF